MTHGLALLPVPLFAILSGLAAVAAGAQAPPANGMRDAAPGPIAIVGGTVVPEPGRAIENGTVLLRDGRVERIGEGLAAPAGYRRIDATGLRVYPGLIEPAFLVDSADAQARAAAGKGAHWNRRVVPQVTVADLAPLDAATVESLRANGFTIAHLLPEDGIFRGTGAVVPLDGRTDGDRRLADAPFAFVGFEYGGWGRGEGGMSAWDVGNYPGSLMGAIALVRQTVLDARWHAACAEVWERFPVGQEPPLDSAALAALQPVAAGRRPALFDAASELDALRALALAEELGIRAAILGGGTEFRRERELVQALKERDAAILLPVRLPKVPDVSSPGRSESVSLRDLWTWELAPTNAVRLAAAGVPFAFTSARLEDRKEFRGNVRQAIRHGLDEGEALAACTTRPARLLGIDEVAGSLAPGKLAHVLLVDGPLFGDETREPGAIRAAVVGGRFLEIDPAPRMPFRGAGTLEVAGLAPVTATFDPAKPSLAFTLADGTKVEAKRLAVKGDAISFTVDGAVAGLDGTLRVGGFAVGDAIELRGEGTAIVPPMRLVAAPDAAEPPPAVAKAPDEDAIRARHELARRPLPFPFREYGLAEPPAREDVLFRNATVWTSGPDGILAETDVLVRDGRIAAIGRGLAAPEGVRTIDAAGRHLTPGLVDCHSHTGISGGVNEGTHSNTAECTIEDVIDAEDIDWYRALAGGLTAANQLHGSANPIGGRNSVVKIRWGEPEAAFRLAGAKPGIKFALGENVVRNRNRYPNTRMGVEAWMRDAFAAAAEHARAHAAHAALPADAQGRTMPPRPDLELDTLAEILRGERLVHCHSYRQDEILMLLRLAESLDFRIGTLQHILEGYKVAEAIAAHGAGASSFSDWWAYKEEVMDAIPHNGALLHELGVLVSFNSDSNELARRMNMEAAKAVRYGGLAPHQALELVTINPARQLRIDDRTGSIEVGKDADLVLWSADPLSVYARVDETWIDGTPRFLRVGQEERARAVESDRQRLLASAVTAREEERARARRKADEESGGEKPTAAPTAAPARGGLLARMIDAREDYILSMIRAGRDPFAIRPGECGCGEFGDLKSMEASR